MLAIVSLSLIVFSGVTLLLVNTNSRRSKMASFARMMNARFFADKENIITEITANEMDFFTQHIHRFESVLSFPQGNTFVRIGDDAFYPEMNPKEKQRVTLLTVELMMNHFPYLKIEPVTHSTHTERYVQMRTGIEEIDKNYNVYLPADTALNLPASLISFLKAHQGIYIESANNVFVMHNYNLLAPTDIQPFRFRAMQLCTDLEIVAPKPQEEGKPAGSPDAATRAEAMITALMASHSRPAAQEKKSSGGMLFIIVILAIGALLFFAMQFLKHNMVR